MNRLSDYHLLAAYDNSVKLQLDPLFINMLKQEIITRKLDNLNLEKVKTHKEKKE
ncbi:sporulation histidine kinase inhibitor Sda [Rossellomorea sp. NS-SX7]|uniref:sporulation histidine kinase inhibitor Sda n=1 Tax=Rossellomorea sp. NS-SX7 TaxID=3463856 RepID=UPI00405839E6